MECNLRAGTLGKYCVEVVVFARESCEFMDCGIDEMPTSSLDFSDFSGISFEQLSKEHSVSTEDRRLRYSLLAQVELDVKRSLWVP